MLKNNNIKRMWEFNGEHWTNAAGPSNWDFQDYDLFAAYGNTRHGLCVEVHRSTKPNKKALDDYDKGNKFLVYIAGKTNECEIVLIPNLPALLLFIREYVPALVSEEISPVRKLTTEVTAALRDIRDAIGAHE